MFFTPSLRLNKPSILNFGFLQSLELLFLMLWRWRWWFRGWLAVWRFGGSTVILQLTQFSYTGTWAKLGKKKKKTDKTWSSYLYLTKSFGYFQQRESKSTLCLFVKICVGKVFGKKKIVGPRKEILSLKYFGSEKILGQKNLVQKIFSQKVFWMGTIVTRTNVAGANVTVTVVPCSYFCE